MNEKAEKKVSFKPTLMDQALMEKIGWSEEEVQSFVEDIDEEEKVGTMKEEQKVATMQEGISGAPGFFSPGLAKQTVVPNKITPKKKARMNRNRIRASYIRQKKKEED